MQNLPKRGEKKDPSAAEGSDSRPDDEKERPNADGETGRSYYYDDAHGYEDYEPDADCDPSEEDDEGEF